MSENNYEFLGGVVLADANGEPYAAGTVAGVVSGQTYQIEITHQGQPVILACTIDHGHTGAHQAYYADRLHHWH